MCTGFSEKAGNLDVVTTPLGRLRMLDGWDHLRPQSTLAVMAEKCPGGRVAVPDQGVLKLNPQQDALPALNAGRSAQSEAPTTL